MLRGCCLAIALPAMLGQTVCAVAAEDCAALRAAYGSALARAQRCDSGSRAACLPVKPAALGDACHCLTWVSPQHTLEVDRLSARYQALGCASLPALCSRQCVAPVSGCSRGPETLPLCGSR